jgi:hypothetical protein
VLLGAVGVSGDTSDNDEICAVAGIEAAGWRANSPFGDVVPEIRHIDRPARLRFGIGKIQR